MRSNVRHIYFSQKQLSRKMTTRLVIIQCEGLYFRAVFFVRSIIIISNLAEVAFA